jgi:type VI secretion system protein ImpJ
VLEGSFAERRLQVHYPYGVIEARFSAEMLENMKVQFETLRAIMPSGLEVHYPENADLPSLDIEEVFNADAEPFTIMLAVPTWYPSRANTIAHDGRDGAAHRSKQIYRVAEVLRTDENTGQNQVPVQVRRINARLITDRDDSTDMETLPLLRVVHSASEEGIGAPQHERNYVPPTVLFAGAPRLAEMIRDLINLLETRRRELAELVRRMNMSTDSIQPNQLGQFLRLRVYNHFAGRLPSLFAAPALTPFDMYLELRGLLGDLAVLYPDRPMLFEAAPYDHNNLMRPFDEVVKKIRNLLVGPKPRYIPLPFQREGRRLVTTLSEEHFKLPNDYFLAISTRMERSQLARLVEDPARFKLMPRNEVESNRYGIRLQAESYTPLELPARAGLYYFRLNRGESGLMWDMVRQQRTLALRWPEMEGSDFFTTDKAVQLVMTVAETETAPAPASG